MPSDENTCPDCGGWKNTDFDLCRDCAQVRRDEKDELVSVSYIARGPSTAKAQAFKIREGFLGHLVWVPRSLLVETQDDRECKAFYVPQWFADNEGLDWT